MGGSGIPPANSILKLNAGTLTLQPARFSRFQNLKTAATDTKISLHWAGASDDDGVGIDRYEVYRNGLYVGTSRTPDFLDNGLAAGTVYLYQIHVKNLFGQEGQTMSFEAKTKAASASANGPLTSRASKVEPQFCGDACEGGCDPTVEVCCDPTLPTCEQPAPWPPVPPIQFFRCSSALYYRPVQPSGTLSLVNHSYWYQTYWESDFDPNTGNHWFITSYDIVEGLPANGNNPPWGQLIANIPMSFDGPANLSNQDNPPSDPQTGVIFEQASSGSPVCPTFSSIQGWAPVLSGAYAYNPVPVFSGDPNHPSGGENSNWSA